MAAETTSTTPIGIKKFIPLLGWLPHYQTAWLCSDLLAGLIAAAVVTP